jgi:hypothetical protein
MTKVKKTVGDVDPKAVENWDNEGGAPASGGRLSVDPEHSDVTNQPAKFIVDRTTWEASNNARANRKSMAGTVTKIEQHPNGRLLYNICVNAPEGRMEFPIAIQDGGTVARNEEAVLRSALRFAEDLAESLRGRLGLRDAEMKNHT